MFDIVVASHPGTPFSPRVQTALRDARMRVVPCEVAPNRPPPVALRVDAAVACAPTGPQMLDVARSVRGALDGPPPLIGVSGGGKPITAPGELQHSLPDDVPDSALVAHVQRVAAQAERRRGRVILRGDLDDVGLDGLLASLAARGRSCFVRVRAGSRRAEITLDTGRVVHVRADGFDPRDRDTAARAVGAWTGAIFEVIAVDDAGPPRSQREPTTVRPPSGAGDAGDVALATAVINAFASYARTWLGPEKAAELLSSSWARVRAERPELSGFAVSTEGFVSVSRVERAKSAAPQAMAGWLIAFFEDAGHLDSVRFRRTRFREVLGGLMRLVEQVGWASALLPEEPPHD